MKTSSGATAVQIVCSYHRGSRQIEHIGSAHDDAELELIKAVARQRLAAGQGVLDLGPGFGGSGGGPLPITASRMGCLLDALSRAYDGLGFGRAAGGDEVFRDLVLARIIEPVSKLDSLRVLEEAGVAPASYATLKRRLPAYPKDAWRQKISAACAAHARLGPASLVLFDVSTLYFETDAGDGFREPGFSKERRLEPQITVGLLTGADGFPLMVSAFEGNKAETKTMLPVIESFMAAHGLPDVTVVADAGMVSEANQRQIEAAGLLFTLGMKIPHVPYVVKQWRREHPGEDVPDGHVFTQPWPAGPDGDHRDQVIYYQYRHDRARRTLRGIDEQVKKAEQAVNGKAPVKRNRLIQLSGGARSVNRELEAKARALCVGVPGPGVLAYVHGQVAGWCSVAPKLTYRALVNSRTIPRVEDEGAWSVVCFVVRPGFRRRGLMHQLLEGAVRHAQAMGAAVLEGYPVDPGGERIDQTRSYVGTVGLFEAHKFNRVCQTAGAAASPAGSSAASFLTSPVPALPPRGCAQSRYG